MMASRSSDPPAHTRWLMQSPLHTSLLTFLISCTRATSEAAFFFTQTFQCTYAISGLKPPPQWDMPLGFMWFFIPSGLVLNLPGGVPLCIKLNAYQRHWYNNPKHTWHSRDWSANLTSVLSIYLRCKQSEIRKARFTQKSWQMARAQLGYDFKSMFGARFAVTAHTTCECSAYSGIEMEWWIAVFLSPNIVTNS